MMKKIGMCYSGAPNGRPRNQFPSIEFYEVSYISPEEKKLIEVNTWRLVG